MLNDPADLLVKMSIGVQMTIVIFVWAGAFVDSGYLGYVGTGLAIVILAVALVYEFRTGTVDRCIMERFRRRFFATVAESQGSA